ncbi:hypothetical protein BDV96DRAFT_654140 [Lophiotrema nucula]|uniref:Uncharacterized protein n=1 Tax=Lophiotrema nucula TaxID=690887 RepID=A0A6A5YJ89_9PLEO|nr:hypothetical protein BDV96DRAFT_654140 [Lophiotrema nucula]
MSLAAMTPVNVTTAIAILAATMTAYIFVATYRHRSHINFLRYQGFVSFLYYSHRQSQKNRGPAYAPRLELVVWTFLDALKYSKYLPTDANVVLAMHDMNEEFAETRYF